jgi:hypothetical protein
MPTTSPDVTCLASSVAVSASSPATPPAMKLREANCASTAPYRDLDNEHFTTFTIDGNTLVNEDNS